MRTHSIPILLLSGFLGSGKTTLLNNLLQNNQNLKIGVIINDFGDINIDSLLVSSQTDTSLELSNGCICCSLEEDSLDNALNQMAHRGSRLDYIVIEASGLAEIRELATMLKMMKNNYCHFDTLVTIVDGLNFEKNNKTSDNVLNDLVIADLIIINKIDLISRKKLEDIKKGIRLISSTVRILESDHGQVDFSLLLDMPDKSSHQLALNNDEQNHHNHKHLHDKFQSISFQADAPIDPQKFEVWAEKLDVNIFRSKGILNFGIKGVNHKFIFQAVGQRYSLKLDEWGFDENPKTNLVVIGVDLDQNQIKKELNKLIDQEPENLSAETLMDIFKYK
ncbi:MAG: GTP-binding protein [Candidatus Saccharibacteria bacterium]|nr:GTP-binding protein [Candidatus Saccharibacteria bacterium]